MSIITELPTEVMSAIEANAESEAALWRWVSGQHYATVVEQNRDHRLVFIQAQVDFSVLTQACAGFHRYAGQRGQAPSYSSGQLCRALVVKYLHSWSHRRTAAEIRSHSLVRWFVGYGLHETTLDHVTLWRFESWVKQHASRLFFDETLRQLDQAFPSERVRPQLGDTFALLSRAREQSRTELLRAAAQRLFGSLAAVTPSGYAVVVAGVAWAALFGQASECPERYLGKPDRDALEIRTARAAHEGLRLAVAQRHALGAGVHTQHLAYQALLRWEGVLGKVLQDEFSFTTEADGRATQVIHLPKKPKGSYRLGSAVDCEATFRLHGEQTQLGYNANLAATPNFVREINAMRGAAPDSSGVADLIANQKQCLGLVPPKFIYDRAAGMAKIFADVARVSDGQTQLVARLINYGKSRERFGPSDFSLNEVGQLVCPNGQSAANVYRSGSADGLNYRFLPEQCQGCPLLAQCRGDKVRPDQYRQVFISDYVYAQRAALAYTKTAAFQVDMKLRPQVERMIAALTRYNGARRATGYGLANADFQLKMCAMAFNLKRWHTLNQAKKKPPRPKPPPPA